MCLDWLQIRVCTPLTTLTLRVLLVRGRVCSVIIVVSSVAPSLPAHEEDSLDKSQFGWMKWLLCCCADCVTADTEDVCVLGPALLMQAGFLTVVSSATLKPNTASWDLSKPGSRRSGVLLCQRLQPCWSCAGVTGVRSWSVLWLERVCLCETERARRPTCICYCFGRSAVTSSWKSTGLHSSTRRGPTTYLSSNISPADKFGSLFRITSVIHTRQTSWATTWGQRLAACCGFRSSGR